MIARFLLSVLLLMSTHPAAANEEVDLDELMTPNEITSELTDEFLTEDITEESTQYSPQIEPLSPAQIYDYYGVSVYSEFPVVMVISKGSQHATVYHYGSAVRSFAVSTGRERWERAKSGRTYFTGTPTGWFSPKRYIRDHWSTTWEANMEYSIFFNGGIAVHATTPDHYKELGRKASGGCVRLHKTNAAWFWNLSRSHMRATVPYFTRSGHILKNRDGSIRRRIGNGTLFIVTSY
ncbi:L,D-transpeptidase [Bdellovibrio sp. HCB337]|uniref:L,D-transpeptidase n=1 Tax=Bdellovibrio sp. HCB337 TaxID=3394358 RepID=UPI0039A469DC